MDELDKCLPPTSDTEGAALEPSLLRYLAGTSVLILKGCVAPREHRTALAQSTLEADFVKAAVALHQFGEP